MANHQVDMLDELEPTPALVCGTCVTWNGLPGDAAGGCPRTHQNMPAAMPACDQWYGLKELRSPIYGRSSR